MQNGWICPEALGLHKLFQFLNRRRRRLHAEFSDLAVSDIKGWRHSICAIRHVAVHRLAQARQSLLQTTQTAMGFVQCTSGPDRYMGIAHSELRIHDKVLQPTIITYYVHLTQRAITDNPPKTALNPVQTIRSPNPLP